MVIITHVQASNLLLFHTSHSFCLLEGDVLKIGTDNFTLECSPEREMQSIVLCGVHNTLEPPNQTMCKTPMES